jgi:hypothetical protein
VLKRLDGSELQRNFVADFSEAPAVGSAIQLTSATLVPLAFARVTAVEILSTVPAGGGSYLPSELVTDNDT